MTFVVRIRFYLRPNPAPHFATRKNNPTSHKEYYTLAMFRTAFNSLKPLVRYQYRTVSMATNTSLYKMNHTMYLPFPSFSSCIPRLLIRGVF